MHVHVCMRGSRRCASLIAVDAIGRLRRTIGIVPCLQVLTSDCETSSVHSQRKGGLYGCLLALPCASPNEAAGPVIRTLAPPNREDQSRMGLMILSLACRSDSPCLTGDDRIPHSHSSRHPFASAPLAVTVAADDSHVLDLVTPATFDGDHGGQTQVSAVLAVHPSRVGVDRWGTESVRSLALVA